MTQAPVTHSYGSGPDRVADLYVPDGDGPFPVAAVVHGGFWRARFDRTLMDAVCRDLSRRGIAAWNVEYRRLGGGGGWPAMLEDVDAAIAALGALADPRLDLARVAAIGHSAGGHLALLAAARSPCGDVPIVGVLALAAVSDLELAERLGLGSGAVGELLGGDLSRMAEASPRAHLPLGIRQVHVHGDADDRVPVEMTRTFVEAARGEARAIVLPGVDHFALIDPVSVAWGRVVEALEELLR